MFTLQPDTLSTALTGDKVEQLLWRLDNGELPAARQPKVVVVMIGTNGAPATASGTAFPAGIQ